MAAFASPGDAYARTLERVSRKIRQAEMECGDISASQQELLARIPSFDDDDGDADAVSDGRDGASAARGADAEERVLRPLEALTVKAGGISVSQEYLLARAPFLGGNGEEEEEVVEVFSAPPAHDQQSPPQQGQVGKGEDAINMCTQPFTQPPASPSPSKSDKRKPRLSKPRNPSVWGATRKVRGNKIRTPTPSPPPSPYVHPLFKAFAMIPSAPLPPPDGDIFMRALECFK